MTDPITCPECEGRRGEKIGDLFLACQFCGGLGWVGGEHEPAERSTAPPPAGPPPIWEHPAVIASGLCRRCLGAREVVLLGGGDEQAVAVRRSRCPECG